MTVKVHGFIADGGDGSHHVRWVRGADYDQFVEWVELNDHDFTYTDGDGVTDRVVLEFNGYDEAVEAGIEFINIREYTTEDSMEESEED